MIFGLCLGPKKKSLWVQKQVLVPTAPAVLSTGPSNSMNFNPGRLGSGGDPDSFPGRPGEGVGVSSGTSDIISHPLLCN